MAHRWPDESRCVAVMSVDFDGTGNEIGLGFEPVGARSAGGYSSKCGIPRMLSIFERHNIPATFFVPGFDAEQHPALVQRIIELGHEVAAHGYLHERWDVSPDEEEALLRRSHDILSRICGIAPVGWRSPGGKKSTRTLEVLQQLGYIYDSSDKDFDLPYPAIVSDQRSNTMIELPNNTSSLDDFPLYVEGAATPGEVLELWKDEFDAIYHDTGYFLLTFHPRAGFGSGTPARAHVIERLIAHIRTYPDVSFMRLRDLAEWTLIPGNGFMASDRWIGGRA
jgi:peptidoglycan-N-acetylglucosamine deacetylase